MRAVWLALLPWRVAGAALALGSLAACGLLPRQEALRQAADAAGARLEAGQQAFRRSVAGDAPDEGRVARPWLAGAPQPLAREITLPAALRTTLPTTLMFADGPLDLLEIAQRITRATGIPVQVRPEALLPLSHFMPRLAQAAAMPPEAAPALYLDDAPQPLALLLDRLAARLGLHWRYEQGRLILFRTETRAFPVRALSVQSRTEAFLGQGGRPPDDGRAVFSSAAGTRFASREQDAGEALKARLMPFLSRAGELAVVPGAAAAVVVTDLPEVLDRIALYLKQENRAMGRRVRLLFEELTLQRQDEAQVGLDWHLVFSRARAMAGWDLASEAGAGAAALTLGLQNTAWAGSEAVIRALGQSATILRRTTVPVLTLNRRPVTHAVRTTFSYIDRIDSTAAARDTASALPTISVSQREQTVGAMLTLLPDVQEDGQILLSMAYDNTVAQPLKSVSLGERSQALQLQQITIDGNGTVQQVALQPGVPLVISGFDRSHDELSRRRLNPDAPLALGGGDRSASQRLTTLLVLTAQLEEDAQ